MNAPRVSKTSTGTTRVKVSPSGRLSLPAEIRRAAGLEGGGVVVLDVKDGAIRLRTIDEALASARAAARKLTGNLSVDDFLRFRRDAWKK